MEIYLKPAVAIADKFAVSMLRDIYRKEDLAWIIGDGGGTYGGTVGLAKRLLDLDGTPANISGVQIAANWSGVNYAALAGLIGRVSKGNTANYKFLTSHRFYWNVMRPIIVTAGGGTDATQIESGGTLRFEGYEIVIDHSGAIPGVSTDATFAAFFGDFSTSSKMLEVSNSMRFDVSEDVYFETDEVGLKYREQVGFNTHGQGTASDSGSYGGLYIKS
jgi:HK97 family phage major capsid protein